MIARSLFSASGRDEGGCDEEDDGGASATTGGAAVVVEGAVVVVLTAPPPPAVVLGVVPMRSRAEAIARGLQEREIEGGSRFGGRGGGLAMM